MQNSYDFVNKHVARVTDTNGKDWYVLSDLLRNEQLKESFNHFELFVGKSEWNVVCAPVYGQPYPITGFDTKVCLNNERKLAVSLEGFKAIIIHAANLCIKEYEELRVEVYNTLDPDNYGYFIVEVKIWVFDTVSKSYSSLKCPKN